MQRPRGPQQGEKARHRQALATRHVELVEGGQKTSAQPRPPRGLSTASRRLWRWSWDAAPWLTPADAPVLEQACRCWDTLTACWARIDADGVTVAEPIQTATGRVVGERQVPHPAMRPWRDAERQWLELSDRLGLNPSARARMGLTVARARRTGLALLVDEHRRGRDSGPDGPPAS